MTAPGTPDARRFPSLVVVGAHARAGLLLGALVSFVDQLVLRSGVMSPPSFRDSLVGTVMTASLYGLVLGMAALPAARSRGNAQRTGRASALPAMAAGLLLGCHGASLWLRVSAGSYVNRGSVEFFVNGWHHLWRTVILGYRVELMLAALFGALVSGGLFLLLRRLSLRSSGRSAVVICALVPLVAVTSPARWGGAWATTPELAMAASMLPDDVWLGPEPKGKLIEAGPKFVAERLWRMGAVASEMPNVLLITLESIRRDRLGYEGGTTGATPELDRIAARSVRFRRAWTTATHSNYSQMAVLSSLFPYRRTGTDMYTDLSCPRFLWHDMLSTIGYRTATISSQDETWQGMLRFQQTGTPTHYVHALDYDGEHIDTGSERVVPDAHTVSLATQWIDQQGDEAWGLYVNLQATHFPYKVPPGVEQPYQPTGPLQGEYNYFAYDARNSPVARNRYDNALRYVDA